MLYPIRSTTQISVVTSRYGISMLFLGTSFREVTSGGLGEADFPFVNGLWYFNGRCHH